MRSLLAAFALLLLVIRTDCDTKKHLGTFVGAAGWALHIVLQYSLRSELYLMVSDCFVTLAQVPAARSQLDADWR